MTLAEFQITETFLIEWIAKETATDTEKKVCFENLNTLHDMWNKQVAGPRRIRAEKLLWRRGLA